jgi:hypothetical protein
MTELFELCPRFDTCSAPKCPLDSLYKVRTQRFSDEPKCTMRKSVRLKIVRENPELDSPFKGYKGTENKGMAFSTQGC